MRVMIAGDTHGNLRHLRDLLNWAEPGVQALIQVGDWGYTWPRGNEEDSVEPLAVVSKWMVAAGFPMLFIEGNHDNYGWLKDAKAWEAPKPTVVAPNVIYCPRGSTYQLSSVKCLFVGGGISVDRYEPDGTLHRRGEQDWLEEGYDPEIAKWMSGYWPEEEITDAQVQRCLKAADIDVVFSHDAPDSPQLESFLINSEMSIPYKLDDLSRRNRDQMNRIVDGLGPRYVFHGHYHHRYNGRRGPTDVIGLHMNGSGAHSHVVVDLDELVRISEDVAVDGDCRCGKRISDHSSQEIGECARRLRSDSPGDG